MPDVERPDGARIHYEVRGDGPLVVLTLGFATTPAVYEGLVADLARDRHVLTWHPRGCGESTEHGPFDLTTDAEDLLALVHAAGPPATVFAVAHGVNVTARARGLDRAAIPVVVTPGIATAVIDHLGGTEGFAASRPVIELLVEQLRRDPRGAVRATTASLNPQLDEAGLRQRVDETLAYTAPETTLARIESWLADDRALEDLRGLGDRLGILWHERDPWQAGAVARVRELFPEAHFEEVEDGPLSRPDLAAAMVRRLS